MKMNRITADYLRSLSEDDRSAIIADLGPVKCAALRYDWTFWSRDDQFIPIESTDWLTILWLAGRGWGKTRTGAESIRYLIQKCGYKRLALIAPTAGDARDVMVEGESGILATSPPWFRPKYQPSMRRLTWPNGAVATLFSAEDPDVLRGPQFDASWLDEIVRYPDPKGVLDMLNFGLRLGTRPIKIITTTPANLTVIKELVRDPTVRVVKSSTFANRHNLAESFLKDVQARYGGTRLGRQELEGELLEDVENAMWSEKWFRYLRPGETTPHLTRIVVAVDPAGGADETGIVVAGMDADGKFWILEDASLHASADKWAARAIQVFDKYEADCIAVETNFGGDMVKSTLTNAVKKMFAEGSRSSSFLPVREVRASRGKTIRAEPVSMLYEKGLVTHLRVLRKLEDEMTSFSTEWDRSRDGSPNRVDALVWAVSELLSRKVVRATSTRDEEESAPQRDTPLGTPLKRVRMVS